MKKMYVTFVIIISSAFVLVSFKKEAIKSGYLSGYTDKLNRFKKTESALLAFIRETNVNNEKGRNEIKEQIDSARTV